MIRMIVLDLDKTLLNNNGHITEFSRNIVERCRLVGIRVVIATGRSLTATKYAIRDLDVDALICNDGAQIFIKDILFENPLENRIANALLVQLSQDCEVKIIKVTTKSGEYSNIDKTEKNGVKYIYWNFESTLLGDIYKIMIQTTTNFAAEKYKSNFICNIRRIREGNNFMITNKNVDKINALQKVANYYELSKEEILAFGDDINDKQMLESCGVGVAMNNASSFIKEIADFVCDTNQNDGVAKWIEMNILNQII